MSARNHEVTAKQQLLDANGNIAEPGWSRSQLQQYSRAQIKAPKFLIKEWDYYLVVGETVRLHLRFRMMGMWGYSQCRCLIFRGAVGAYRDSLRCISNGKIANADKYFRGRYCL